MSYFLNTECPCCNKTITAEDELAVCPICGTPHHRACYFEHGHCFNEPLHGDGFEWKPPAAAESPVNEPIETVVCKTCSRSTSKDGSFCNYCGAPMQPLPLQRAPFEASGRQDGFFVNGPAAKYDPEEEIDGIPIKDWAEYIGSSSNYYLYNFKLQDRSKRKTAFTFSAALFPFLFFLYRRVWWAAILSAVTNFLILIPYFFSTVLLPLGIDFGSNAVSLDNALNISRILSLLVNLCWGLFAVWFYRRKAGRSLLRMKDEASSDIEYKEKLLRAAGPSKTAVIIVGSVLFGLIFVTLFASEFLSAL